jgi:hypothetical protein
LYVGEFTAPIDGEVDLSVNDAVFLWGSHPAFFYTGKRGQNKGTAGVIIEPAPPDATTSEPKPADCVAR